MNSVMPWTSACASRSLHRPLAPGEIASFFSHALPAIALGDLKQPLGCVGPAVEDHVLARLAQFRIDIVVDRELAGVDDRHVHARLDGVIEEHRVHRPRTGSLPRNENDTFDTPPEMCTCGQVLLDQRAPSMKSTP